MSGNLEYGTWNMDPETGKMEAETSTWKFGIWKMEQTWNLELGTCNLEPESGTWNLNLGMIKNPDIRPAYKEIKSTFFL